MNFSQLSLALRRKKSIATYVQPKQTQQLQRSIGLPSVIGIGLGCIIGTGIFVLTGKVALQHSGSGIMLSFLLSGIACLLAALCYAEFSSYVPTAGSAYAYSYVTMGELVAWLIGWDLILEYGLAIVTVASGWSSHFVSILSTLSAFFGYTNQIPTEWVSTPYDPILATNAAGEILRNSSGEPIIANYGSVNLPAMAIVFLLSFLLLRGNKSSFQFNNLMVLIKISIALFFVGVGFFFVNPDNWFPLIPEFLPRQEIGAITNTTNLPLWQVIGNAFGYNFISGFGGISGVFTGAAILFYAYLGFDAITTSAEEVKNPTRNLPLGIIISVIICTVLYILMSAVFTGIVKVDGSLRYEELGIYRGAPLAYAFSTVPHLNRYALLLVEFGGFIGITSVLLVLLYAQSRIIFAISRDGLLPNIFSTVHTRKKVPIYSTIIFGTILTILAGFMPLHRIAELVNIGTLAAFFLVSLSIIIIRNRKDYQNNTTGFRIPWSPTLPAISMFTCTWLMISLPVATWIRFTIWMIAGLIFYAVYGFHKSKLKQKN